MSSNPPGNFANAILSECFFKLYISFTNRFVFFRGLKNDNIAETFTLKKEIHDNLFPCRYIKIGMRFTGCENEK